MYAQGLPGRDLRVQRLRRPCSALHGWASPYLMVVVMTDKGVLPDCTAEPMLVSAPVVALIAYPETVPDPLFAT